jgi:hypothetical protein
MKHEPRKYLKQSYFRVGFSQIPYPEEPKSNSECTETALQYPKALLSPSSPGAVRTRFAVRNPGSTLFI